MESISGRRRKDTFSIEYIEKMFVKESYPLSRKPKRKIVIGGETIRYYNPNYHMFFKKGYSCVKCGLTGKYYALESSGGDGTSFSLCLYALDKNNNEVLMVGAKIDPNLEKTTKHYYDIQPVCQRCIYARDKLPIYMKAVKSNPYITQTLIRDRKRTDLLKIPGVGKVTKERLNRLGYYFMEDLIGQHPESIYKEDCDNHGETINRRMLALYRKAVEYADGSVLA